MEKQGSGQYNLRSVKYKAKPCRVASQALHLPSLRFLVFSPPLSKGQYYNWLLELLCISHAVCGNLFFCGFKKNHILLWSGNEKAIALSEAHKELAVLQAFGCFVKALDFDSLAVAVDDSFWIHKDGNYLVGFKVGKLWHQS